MHLNDYQQQSRKTAIYPDRDKNLIYPVLGLTGESGEVAEKVKKMIRDDHGVLSEERKQAIVKELGDVLWYLAQCASEIGVSLEDIAQQNLQKLFARLEQNKLHGDGDDR